MPKSVTDKEEQAKLDKKALEGRSQELDDIKKILNTAEGMRFFKRFFDEGYMFHTSFTGNSQTYFNEGRRDYALKFFGDVQEICPGKVPELLIRNKGE